MSRSSTPRRKAAVLTGAVAAAALGVLASSAQANQYAQLNYACKYPLLSEAQPLQLQVESDLPTNVGAFQQAGNTLSAALQAMGDTHYAIDYIQASELSGSGKVNLRLNGAGLADFISATPFQIARTPVVDANGQTIDPVSLIGHGSTPSVSFGSTGALTTNVNGFTLKLTAYDFTGTPIPNIPNNSAVPDSDSDPFTFDVGCTLSPASQDTKLTPTRPTPTPTVVPTNTPSPTPIAPTPTQVQTPTPPVTPTPTVTPTQGPAQAGHQYARLGYACRVPLLSADQPLTLDLDALLPDATGPGQVSPQRNVDVVARLGGDTPVALAGYIGASSLSGKGDLRLTLDGGGLTALPVKVPVTFGRTAVSNPDTYPWPVIDLAGTGTIPSIGYPSSGPVTAHVTSFSYTLIAYDESGYPIPNIPNSTGVPQSDTDPDTFDVSCTLAPSNQDTALTKTTPTGTPPPLPTPSPSPTPPSPTATPNVGPTPTPPVNPTPTKTPTPTRTPTPTVIYTNTKTPTPTPTPTPTKTPVPTQTVTPTKPAPTPTGLTATYYSYGIAGSATLKNLVKGTLPVTGSIYAGIGIGTGDFTGQLTLNQSTANLTALGILPVTASVNLVSTEAVTGNLSSAGVLKATAKVRIKLPSIKTFGIQLAGGANCQATQVSTIPLTSTAFSRIAGGTLTGTFAISNLSGCGSLTGIVSPLTSGSGNSIALKLTA